MDYSSYPPLLHRPSPSSKKKLLRCLSVAGASAVLLLCLLSSRNTNGVEPGKAQNLPVSRGPAAGVSEKSTGSRLFSESSYPWTNNMFLWQRTSFHFQPEKNWMNGLPLSQGRIYLRT